MDTNEQRLSQDSVHMDKLGANSFVITMMGAVAFLVACVWVIAA